MSLDNGAILADIRKASFHVDVQFNPALRRRPVNLRRPISVDALEARLSCALRQSAPIPDDILAGRPSRRTAWGLSTGFFVWAAVGP